MKNEWERDRQMESGEGSAEENESEWAKTPDHT